MPADAVADDPRRRARRRRPRAKEIERRTNHDVIAFTESIAEQVGPAARWFHYGLTSSDVVDTGLALQLRDAGAICCTSLDRAIAAVAARAIEHRDTPCIGRTHGVHAEPTTFGLKLLGWLCELERNRDAARRRPRRRRRRQALRRRRRVRQRRPARRGARRAQRSASASSPPPRRSSRATATPRCSTTLAVLGSSLDRFATEIRHLQRTEVREAEEPFGRGQKGSSAMPHKRNPITCERISGLARVLRGNAVVGARERAAVARARHLPLLRRARRSCADSTILARLHARPLRVGHRGPRRPARADAARTSTPRTACRSPAACCCSWSRPASRARRPTTIVQRNAMRAWETDEHLRDLIAADPDAAAVPAVASSTRPSTSTTSCATSTSPSTARCRREEPIDAHA